MITLVRISDIGLYLRSPRLVYFDALSLPKKVSPVHLLLRGLILCLSEDEFLETQLSTRLAKLGTELPLIYGDAIEPKELDQAAQEVEALMPGLAQGPASCHQPKFAKCGGSGPAIRALGPVGQAGSADYRGSRSIHNRNRLCTKE
jgi:hypothetical protein